jgi:hypothetical protein
MRFAREVSQTFGWVAIKQQIFFMRLPVGFNSGFPAERNHILQGFATRMQRERE